MRILLVLVVLLAGGAWAQDEPEPTLGTEVFTGSGEAPRPAERPAKPVTTYWRVHLFVTMADAPPGAHAQVLLPLSDRHQEIFERRVDMDGLTYREVPDSPNLVGSWTRTRVPSGTGRIEYAFEVAVADTTDPFPHVVLSEQSAPERYRKYLNASELVQSGDGDIRRRARDLI